MEDAQRFLVQLSIFLLFFYSTAAQLNSSIERLALIDLRSSLGLRGADWPLKLDPCSKWNGVQCKDGRVTGINISGFRRTRIGRANSSFSVDSLANLMFLEYFNASRFSLPGSIPSWFGLRVSALQVLDLRYCSVTGAIPDSLGNLSRLRVLHLSHNRLVGSIPSALGQLMELSVLDLSVNSLIGQIPSSFGLLRSVSRLDLFSNYISGPIPGGLGNISGLQFLELSDNSLTGSVPPELGNLSQLVELNLSKNSLSGSLPVELANLRNLQRMEVGVNELEGALPDVLLSGLEKLQVAVLSRNKFDGAIPSVLLSLPNLLVLDLSYNNLTGFLPSTFSFNSNSSGFLLNLSSNLLYGDLSSSFVNFSSIDLSGNYIEGKFPKSSKSNISVERNCLQAVLNQRSLENCQLFYAERGLRFDNFGAPEPTQPPLPEASAPPKKRRKWIYILVGLLVGVGFIAILVLLMVVILKKCGQNTVNQRGVADVEPVEEGDNLSIPKNPTTLSSLKDSFTYEQLLRSTGAFSEANLIKHGHSGDLFKGLLDSGSPIVVKKVNLNSIKKESFMMEMEFFNKYSHIRLVPFLGHCSENENEKLLVYKYMPNRDLASSLFRVSDFEDDSLQSLDWITRLKIATGTAEGLSYLHHECNPPLVHRDIQASSILLDDKFEVRLGSLNEVRILEGDSHHNVLTRLMRKQQSFEPSTSGLSSATCAYDVYCFGKVLLELITGKLGISKSDDIATREWLEHTLTYINVYDKELVTKILDPSLIIDEDLLEEVWAMAIVARSCLNPRPSKRPPMKYILKALENPLKVVRQESYNSSGRLRTTSSRRSWSTAFFGSWRQSSMDNATVLGHQNREAHGLKQSGRVNSSGVEHSSSNKRLSNEIFPEPLEMQDLERQDEH